MGEARIYETPRTLYLYALRADLTYRMLMGTWVYFMKTPRRSQGDVEHSMDLLIHAVGPSASRRHTRGKGLLWLLRLRTYMLEAEFPRQSYLGYPTLNSLGPLDQTLVRSCAATPCSHCLAHGSSGTPPPRRRCAARRRRAPMARWPRVAQG